MTRFLIWAIHRLLGFVDCWDAEMPTMISADEIVKKEVEDGDANHR